MAQTTAALTENEGVLLALVVRAGPITAYQISKAYERSPVSNFSSSKGKIYPIIKRLRASGLLKTVSIEGDKRGTEQLLATKSGGEAVRQWVLSDSPGQLLPDDPIRTRLQSFDLLRREEKIQWISDLKLKLRDKLEAIEQYRDEVSVPHIDLVHDNAVRTLRTRMDWLDTVLSSVVCGDA